MCSGGDLDGDDYLVIWDQELIPKEWNLPPMDFTPLKPVTLNRDVTVDDITAFFVQYMKNDLLPTIALAHLCWADYEDEGIKDEKCKQI
jgi:RNA-dependent RNA polymerase